MEEALSEVEALRCIFEEAIEVEECLSDRDPCVHIRQKVRPRDEGGVSSASVRLEFTLRSGYPEEPATVVLREPRGLSDEDTTELRRQVAERTLQGAGMPVVYEIIQFVSDFLASNQHSSSLVCPICLSPFSGQPVSCTPCDHYTHAECLQAHNIHSRRALGEALKTTPPHMHSSVDRALYCPVCRTAIQEEIEPICATDSVANGKQKRSSALKSPKSLPGACNFEFDWAKWRETQKQMQTLFQAQKERGGIIDPEEERKKDLITEDTVVQLSNEMGQLVSDSIEPASSSKGETERLPRGAGDSGKRRRRDRWGKGMPKDGENLEFDKKQDIGGRVGGGVEVIRGGGSGRRRGGGGFANGQRGERGAEGRRHEGRGETRDSHADRHPREHRPSRPKHHESQENRKKNTATESSSAAVFECTPGKSEPVSTQSGPPMLRKPVPQEENKTRTSEAFVNDDGKKSGGPGERHRMRGKGSIAVGDGRGSAMDAHQAEQNAEGTKIHGQRGARRRTGEGRHRGGGTIGFGVQKQEENPGEEKRNQMSEGARGHRGSGRGHERGRGVGRSFFSSHRGRGGSTPGPETVATSAA